jgi:ribosomal protein S18 acetylase RimI-like enzyme
MNNETITFKISRTFKENIIKFGKVVYSNFIGIKDELIFNHTPETVVELLSSVKLISIVGYNEKGKVISYLLGEIEPLPDGRLVFFIVYLYVANKYRNRGIGKELLRRLHNYLIFNIGGISFIIALLDKSRQSVLYFYWQNDFRKDYMHDEACRIDNEIYCKTQNRVGMYKYFLDWKEDRFILLSKQI